jgi:hypothetical protein
MSTRILWQWNPNTSDQLVPLEQNGKATADELTLSTIFKNHGKLKKLLITKITCPPLQTPKSSSPHLTSFRTLPLSTLLFQDITHTLLTIACHLISVFSVK